MPLMIKLNRNIMKVDLCLDNGHFITVFSDTSKRGFTKLLSYNCLIRVIPVTNISTNPNR